MNNTPDSRAPNDAALTKGVDDSLNKQRESLRRVLAYHGVDTEEVERVLGAYVTELREQGSSAEAVVIAVKNLLAEQEPPPADGPDATKAFRVARNSSALYGAIVTLAIAQYYGIDLRAIDLRRISEND